MVDSEGLDSLRSDNELDAKMFALATLLSSYLIYNSVGAIDENSINQLALVQHLISTIAVDENEKAHNEYQLSQYAPKFLWVLRDFMLEIRDVKDRIVNS